MKDRYEIRSTCCDCHPETCCCNPFSVIDNTLEEGMNVVVKTYKTAKIIGMVKLANKAWKRRQKKK